MTLRQDAFKILICLFASSPGLANAQSSPSPKSKVIYKKYTEINFTGDTVEGKARTPELFYIFQRKRSAGLSAVRLPDSMKHHDEMTLQTVKGSLPE